MSKDDWKYYDEDMWDDKESEEEEEEKTVQCHHCTRFVDAASPYCTYCGRTLPKK